MVIKTQFSEKDFINMNFAFTYGKKGKIIFVILSFIFLIPLFLLFIASPKHFGSPFLGVSFMIIGNPIFLYFIYKWHFKKNLRNKEQIEYHFEKEQLFIKGETFTSNLNWSNYSKIKKTKNWIFIFQKGSNAIAIPKAAFSATELAALKEIISENGIKNNL